MSFTYNDIYGISGFGINHSEPNVKANTHRKKGFNKLADWVISGVSSEEKSFGYSLPKNREKTTSSAVVNVASVASVKDMVDRIQSTFGLNVSQIAKIVGVSRATLYNHINDDSAVAEHYVDFYRLSVDVEKQYGCVASVLKNILVSDRTLLRHLECSYKNRELIFSVLDRIKDYKPSKSVDYGSISEQKRSNMVYVVGGNR